MDRGAWRAKSKGHEEPDMTEQLSTHSPFLQQCRKVSQLSFCQGKPAVNCCRLTEALGPVPHVVGRQTEVLTPQLRGHKNTAFYAAPRRSFHSLWFTLGRLLFFPLPVSAQMLTRGRLFATPWTVARQAPLSTEFSRQAYWSGLPLPPPGDLPSLGIKPMSPVSPALQADFLPAEPSGKPLFSLKSI